MALLNVFEKSTTTAILKRLEKLKGDTVPQWGKMNAAQMLAHLNVNYDITYGKKEVNNNAFKRFMFKLFLKSAVVSEKPYRKNGGTAPYFIIKGDRNFEEEKAKLINYIKMTEEKGAAFFEGKESSAFGALTSKEWSNQFYKHMDHHFQQFGI